MKLKSGDAVGLASSSGLLRKPVALKPESYMDKPDHNRYLNKWANDGSKRSTGIKPENGNRHGNGKFKVVAGSGKGQRCGFTVVGTHLLAHPERNQEHHDKVYGKWNGDAYDVKG